MLLPGVGHSAAEEGPDQVNELLLEFPRAASALASRLFGCEAGIGLPATWLLEHRTGFKYVDEEKVADLVTSTIEGAGLRSVNVASLK